MNEKTKPYLKTHSYLRVKAINFLVFLLLLHQISFGQELSMPANYAFLDSVSGDLDNDSIAELVVA